jgi:NAD(P)-dependent dehydrogenase (short-subunit alcohol dehydrogenase family)
MLSLVGFAHMQTILVVGASRGIGLELARQYAADGWRVHATTRTPAEPGTLGALAGEIVLHELDVTDRAGLGRLATALDDDPLDVLVHNAGVYGTGMTRDEVLRINAEAPIAVADALLPRMRRNPPGRPAGRIVLMTSQMGARHGRRASLGLYGDSKAALNDRFREHAPDWARTGVIAIVMHPGWVRTDMGGAGAPLSVAESVGPMRRTIARLRTADHGRFLTWDGREHPW